MTPTLGILGAGTKLGTLSRLYYSSYSIILLAGISVTYAPSKSHDIGSPLAKNTGQMSEEFTGTVTSLGC